jgi:hypothetical protein
MLELFRRDQIDTDKWDECITHSKQSIIYALSWYLDIVSPNWIAFIKEEKGRYSSVLPIAFNRKFAINYIFQPSFTQQLGLFSEQTNNDQLDLDEVQKKMIKKFNFINYHYNTSNTEALKTTDKIILKERLTHHLQLNSDYQTLFKAYSENHKRNIKKSASKNLHLKYSDNISGLISLFKKEIGNDLAKVKEDNYKILLNLFKESTRRDMCKLIFSEDENGELEAGGLFLFFNSNITYLFGASSKEGKQHGAMSMIFNEVIRQYSGTSKILDFEGSDIESIARFYRSFGAQAVPYILMKYNNLPFFLKIFKP